MLDRRRGADPPRMLVRRPAADAGRRARPTSTSRSRIGTNLALMNALLRELIAHGWYDEAYVAAHTLGFDELERRGRRRYTPERVAEICDVPARRRRARPRELLGTSRAAALDGAAGLLPVEPGHGRGVPGQQPPPAARA